MFCKYVIKEPYFITSADPTDPQQSTDKTTVFQFRSESDKIERRTVGLKLAEVLVLVRTCHCETD